ncbi:uncharacterized protein LOC5513907 [Nematostella vectensis]|uniref:uncharacterized protein LOC5513907 n=1 Tax=Nematostella vectensis TaxID=45351 RepID=UPI0020772C23|nr:uncharacterized protein LOC5513907 [Nematostella vectensis]
MNLIFRILCVLILTPAILGQNKGAEKEAVHIKTSERVQNDERTVGIDVETEKIDLDAKGNFADAEILKVNLQVSVIEGNIHVNGMRAKHGSVTAFHFHAEIDEIGPNKKLLKHHMLPIVIRVLVVEQHLVTGTNTLNKLIVEAQIREIYGKTIRDIDVTQVDIRLSNDKKEMTLERKVTVIRLAESKIHNHKPEHDIDVHSQGGRLPKTKLHASKEQMDDYYRHQDKLGPARTPKHPLHASKTSLGGKMDEYEHSICRGFYRLPFAVRLSIFLLVTFIGLLTTFCCIRAFCCKPAAKGKKYNIDDYYDNKYEFDADMDAPPLDTKIPLEKQKLVIDA